MVKGMVGEKDNAETLRTQRSAEESKEATGGRRTGKKEKTDEDRVGVLPAGSRRYRLGVSRQDGDAEGLRSFAALRRTDLPQATFGCRDGAQHVVPLRLRFGLCD